MTEVAFHFNAPDRMAYACRLLRKDREQRRHGWSVTRFVRHTATTGQSPVGVFHPPSLCRIAFGRATRRVAAASPVVLAPSAESAPHRQVLLNLAPSVPDGFEQFERVIEVVSLDDDERQSARNRWKHYVDHGYDITRHDLNLKA